MSYTRQLRLDEATFFAVQNTRTQDHDTSIEAAQGTYPRVIIHRQKALRAHYEHPEGLTDFDLDALTGIHQTSVGKRRLELQRAGFIEKTETKRPSPRNSGATVWRITDAGKAEYERQRDAAIDGWNQQGRGEDMNDG